MDTTIKCNNCGREMGLAEFLTYPEAYLLKLIAASLVPLFISALAQKIAIDAKENKHAKKGLIDESMAGLAKNFSIECPICGEINWYPLSQQAPKKNKKKSNELVV